MLKHEYWIIIDISNNIGLDCSYLTSGFVFSKLWIDMFEYLYKDNYRSTIIIN